MGYAGAMAFARAYRDLIFNGMMWLPAGEYTKACVEGQVNSEESWATDVLVQVIVPYCETARLQTSGAANIRRWCACR